ncbi:MAG TPA: hypothetical protein VJG48_03305 [Candidatus Paceibacterota bacterium]
MLEILQKKTENGRTIWFTIFFLVLVLGPFAALLGTLFLESREYRYVMGAAGIVIFILLYGWHTAKRSLYEPIKSGFVGFYRFASFGIVASYTFVLDLALSDLVIPSLNSMSTALHYLITTGIAFVSWRIGIFLYKKYIPTPETETPNTIMTTSFLSFVGYIAVVATLALVIKGGIVGLLLMLASIVMLAIFLKRS